MSHCMTQVITRLRNRGFIRCAAYPRTRIQNSILRRGLVLVETGMAPARNGHLILTHRNVDYIIVLLAATGLKWVTMKRGVREECVALTTDMWQWWLGRAGCTRKCQPPILAIVDGY